MVLEWLWRRPLGALCMMLLQNTVEQLRRNYAWFSRCPDGVSQNFVGVHLNEL